MKQKNEAPETGKTNKMSKYLKPWRSSVVKDTKTIAMKMLGPAVNRQPGYRRRGLVELETIPNDSVMIDLRLMSNSKKVQKRFEISAAVFEPGPATYLIDLSFLKNVFKSWGLCKNWGSGCGVQGFGFRIEDWGSKRSRVWEFKDLGVHGFRVWRFTGFRV